MTATDAPIPYTLARKPMTDRQALIYRAVIAHWRTFGESPTVRDLCVAAGISTPNGVYSHLVPMRKKGWIDDEDTGNNRHIYPAGLRDLVREAAGALEQ